MGKTVAILVMGAFMVVSFSSLALAQKGQQIQDAAKMRSDGWKMFLSPVPGTTFTF